MAVNQNIGVNQWTPQVLKPSFSGAEKFDELNYQCLPRFEIPTNVAYIYINCIQLFGLFHYMGTARSVSR